MIPDMTLEDDLRKNWGWLLVLGVALVVLGLIALTFSLASTLATVVFLGVLLLIAGGFEIGNAFRHRMAGGFWLHLFTGILDLVCGAILLAFPGAGAAGITLLLAVFFLVGGPVRAIASLAMRLPNRGWAVLSGLIDFALGLMLLFSWPDSALWLLGTLVGIGLIFRGVWWASYALKLYRPSHEAPMPSGENGTHGAASA